MALRVDELLKVLKVLPPDLKIEVVGYHDGEEHFRDCVTGIRHEIHYPEEANASGKAYVDGAHRLQLLIVHSAETP